MCFLEEEEETEIREDSVATYSSYSNEFIKMMNINMYKHTIQSCKYLLTSCKKCFRKRRT